MFKRMDGCCFLIGLLGDTLCRDGTCKYRLT